MAAEPLDLLRELTELKPTVVHFAGHGGGCGSEAPGPAGARDVVASAPLHAEPPGLYFQDAKGSAQVVSSDAIARTFGAAGASVKLVVLNACYTASIAEALLAHVDCVVGMSGAVHDDAARSFAIGFYNALGGQESVAAAYEHGKAAVCLDGLPHADQPQLLVREGLRPGERPAQRLGQALGAPGQPWAAADRIAALLADREPGCSVLVVIDQLKELFTLTIPEEREPFLAALRDLRVEPHCRVIFTLRADFYGALMESALWREHRGQLSRVEVGPLSDEAL